MKKLSVLLICLIFTATISASEKKGIGLADLNSKSRVESLHVKWYYTWKPQPIKGITQIEFVPMLTGKTRKVDSQISELLKLKNIPYLLAFNEPDRTDQDNMSVEEVVQLWPKISVLSKKISSPAISGPLTPWFDKFYRIAKKHDIKYDFMAIHVYCPPDATKFLNQLDQTYSKYKMPIWITEFAVADWSVSKRNCKKPKDMCKNRYSEDEVMTFMKTVLPELEKRPFIERYAWYGAGKLAYSQEAGRPSRLFEKDGSLTPLGKFYAEFK